MKKIKLGILLLLVSMVGCKNEKPHPDGIVITNTPTNIETINSEYDDYNSDLPYPYDPDIIKFSSNRDSNGKEFNIIAKGIGFFYEKKKDILTITNTQDISTTHFPKLVEKSKSNFDELGPYTLSIPNSNEALFFYSKNDTEKFNINFIQIENTGYSDTKLNGPFLANALNSTSNDLYPTFDTQKTIYFCSDREEGSYNIFRLGFNEEVTSEIIQTKSKSLPEKVEVLSSAGDDKCPFFYKNTMVFTSNRPGGLGGYDLYYAHYTNGTWSAPVNFGEPINSIYDDYRPIITEAHEKHVMIFSSNRSGGKGGFDLYIMRLNDLMK